MCLTRCVSALEPHQVAAQKSLPHKWRRYWKVFFHARSANKILFVLQTTQAVQIGQVMIAPPGPLLRSTDDGVLYTPGFHVFLQQATARNWVVWCGGPGRSWLNADDGLFIIPVMGSLPLAYGFQDRDRAYVVSALLISQTDVDLALSKKYGHVKAGYGHGNGNGWFSGWTGNEEDGIK